MDTYADIQQKLNAAISRLGLIKEPTQLYEPIDYIMGLGGKRVRPMLTLMAAQLYDNAYYNAMSQALAVEVFHNFTLVHDDIMDEAPLRRNQPTVHLKWDTNTGILSGDAMLIKAYQLLSATAPLYLSEVLVLFNDTALGVCEGQQYDMEFETRDEVSIEEYLKMIELKTAVLLACALKMGALVAGAPANEADALYRMGINLGLAFQLQDDILDVYGTAKVGKRVGGDIISNKKTFMLITALQTAKGSDLDTLNNWIAATDFNDDEKVAAVTELYNKLGVKEASEQKMNAYTQQAIADLDALNVAEERKANLRQIIGQLLVRES
jgi:geranylgeranyl diphosphate synthase type II